MTCLSFTSFKLALYAWTAFARVVSEGLQGREIYRNTRSSVMTRIVVMIMNIVMFRSIVVIGSIVMNRSIIDQEYANDQE
jgi:hypothetical protein